MRRVTHPLQEFIMHGLTVLRGALLCLAATYAPLAAPAPLAPFLLTRSGPVEIKYTGYQAFSKDAGGTGLKEAAFAAGYMTSINEYGNGASTYLANCVQGPACLYFRTRSRNGGGADFFGISTMTTMLAGSALYRNGWAWRVADPVIAQVELPESGSLALLAAGMLALAMRRRSGAICVP